MSRSGASRQTQSVTGRVGQPVADRLAKPATAPAAEAFAQRPLAGSRVVLAGSSAEAAGTSDEVLRSAFDRSPSGMSVSALDGRWLRINDAYCRLLGRERAELLGGSSCDVTHRDDLAADREFAAAAVSGGSDILEREKRFVRRDGSVLWARVRTEVIRDGAGEPLYFVSHAQDVIERRAAEDRLHESERMLRSMIDNTPAIICVKGRDHRYKLVNRGFEQHFGVNSDWVVGRSDADVLPPSKIDEIHAKDLLVLDGARSGEEEETVARDGQERVMLRTRFPLLNEEGEIDAVCITSTDITERRLEERSKRERLQCSELIYSALAQDRFVLHGQAIVDLSSMEAATVELLIRMLNVSGGGELLAPAMFLPAAERFDLITVVDEWVVGHALALAAAGHGVTVNVSAKTISESRQVDRIERALVASGAPAEKLIFEITETTMADNLEAARTFAMRMRKLGCAIALDDFGVGHGSFTYLRHLPIDYLKIDMQFVRDLLSDEDDRQVVQAIIGVARQFQIKTIAEGVEDQATLEELRHMGVDYAQGYWTGRPKPLSQCWTSSRHRRRGDTHAHAIRG